ncbi:hypothetical protein Dsin_018269 [Dipteronia sinensis]|uniref:Glycosyltransferase n=1 Tax=Dipteronia sinensis TaxID=43782 RepID=A0AAE0E1R3_9ROSI|nr:hypothetical protein Dsin_018269 [Dipteronia sinensis]
MPPPPHFLLVVFPAQGHINPALQLAKRLLRMGARVTYATSVSAQRRMTATAHRPDGLTFVAFSDGYDDGLNSPDDDNVQQYLSVLKRRGSETLTHLIAGSEMEGRPVSCLIYTLLLPWASEVARGLHIPSVHFWIQPAMVFDIYYYYFYGYGDVITKSRNDPSCLINLPGLPPLTSRDLPSFLISSNNYSFALPSFQEQLKTLDQETKPRILVNTCDALEPEALRAIDKVNMVAIGPSIPSAFLDGEDPNDTCFGGDIFHGHNSKDYKEWLNSKSESSVVYVSFGSLAVLKKPQMEEIARGLLDSGHPFLWVIRSEKGNGDEEEKLSCMEELEQQGMIVTWCSQVEVLSHPAVGCFVTHCGWNSTLESLVSGVAVVAYPQCSDQTTNSMLIEKEWRTGVRVKLNEQGVAEREEIGRCLKVVMGGGEQTQVLSENVKKWKNLTRDAAKDGGSSHNNLKAFVDEFRSYVVVTN